MSSQKRSRKSSLPRLPPDIKADARLFSVQDFLLLLKRMRIYIFLGCIILCVSVFLLARHDIQTSPEFTSSVDVQILPGDLQLDFARATLGGTRNAQIASIVRSFSEELMSDEVLTRSIASIPDFSEEYSVDGSKGFGAYLDWLNYGELPEVPPDPLELVREAAKISSIDGSFVMRISVTLPDPKRAADLANAIVAAYAQIEREELERARADLLAAFSIELGEAETELRGLIEEELQLREALPTDPGLGNETSDLPSEEVADLRMNLQRQEAMVRAIASLRGELVDRQIAIGNSESKTFVVRMARPARQPDGPSPLIEGLAAAAGLFLFFVGSLVLATIASGFSRKTAPK